MPLQPAVQGARHTAQVITFQRLASAEVVDLTGAAVTGLIKNVTTGAVRAITGTTTNSGATGIITWTYSAADIADAGAHTVQFIATYADTTTERSIIADWMVLPILVIP